MVRAIAERPGPLAREAAHELGHEVLRVGRRAAVAEGEHPAAGEQALGHAPADLEQELRRARGEEALLEGDAVRDEPPDVVGVHPLRIMREPPADADP